MAVWHVNKSDIMHFHLHGGSLVYDVIDQEGRHERHVLGQDFRNGEVHQLLVKGGCFKATTLVNGEYGFVGEAVAPGFEYEDSQMVSQKQMCLKFPHRKYVIERSLLKQKINKYKIKEDK